MKKLIACLALLVSSAAFSQSIIIDHSCCKIEEIPAAYIQKAKAELRISYGHTSHGSQLVTGMNLLKSEPGSIFTFNSGSGSLDLMDYTPAGDLGNPDRTTWAARTRDMINSSGFNRNVVMWSWCGQVDGSEADINKYLELMSGLEDEFPSIKFIYMTGHLNGTGENGNVNRRNNQIRDYCKKNGKILFDFADIESYDPDGVYFLNKNANDNCDYTGGNWAQEWCEKNPGKCKSCGCAHSQCLNCQQKGKAFWNLTARLAGWDGITGAEEKKVGDIEIMPNPAEDHILIKGIANNSIVLVSNLFGQKVLSAKADTSELKLDVSSLPSGIYAVVAEGEKPARKLIYVSR